MTRPYRQGRTIEVRLRASEHERDAWDAAAAAAGVSRSEWLREAALERIRQQEGESAYVAEAYPRALQAAAAVVERALGEDGIWARQLVDEILDLTAEQIEGGA